MIKPKTPAPPIKLSDLPALANAGKFAVLLVDDEYLFHKLNQIQAPEILPGFTAFGDDFRKQIPVLREAGVPLVHVAYDLTHSIEYRELDEEDRLDIDSHCQTYIQNINDLTVRRPTKKGEACLPHEKLIKTDLMHDVQDGEMIFLKRDCSALDRDDPELRRVLKEKQIEAFGLAGLYLTDCIGSTGRDGIADFSVLAITDMIYSQTSLDMRNTQKRQDRVQAYFKAMLPNVLCTDMEEFASILDLELTP